MNTLFITIKKKYFDEIKSGYKTMEYRLAKPFWVNKLVGRKYDTIIFQNGYSKTSSILECEYLGFKIKNIRHEFFGNEDVTVFAIKIGRIIKNEKPYASQPKELEES